MENAVFEIDELSGSHTAKTAKQALDALPGVRSVTVDGETDHVSVDYDATGTTREELRQKLIDEGFHVLSDGGTAQRSGKGKGKRKNGRTTLRSSE